MLAEVGWLNTASKHPYAPPQTPPSAPSPVRGGDRLAELLGQQLELAAHTVQDTW